MSYCVVRADELSGLEEKVKVLLNQGWFLVGGVAASDVLYLQAMFQPEVPEPPRKGRPPNETRVS